MRIEYLNKKIEKICTNYKESKKLLGRTMADKVFTRIQQIRTFETVKELIDLHIGRCHKLEAERKGQYAMDLEHPYRLIFTIKGDLIEIATIIEVVDYH